MPRIVGANSGCAPPAMPCGPDWSRLRDIEFATAVHRLSAGSQGQRQPKSCPGRSAWLVRTRSGAGTRTDARTRDATFAEEPENARRVARCEQGADTRLQSIGGEETIRGAREQLDLHRLEPGVPRPVEEVLPVDPGVTVRGEPVLPRSDPSTSCADGKVDAASASRMEASAGATPAQRPRTSLSRS